MGSQEIVENIWKITNVGQQVVKRPPYHKVSTVKIENHLILISLTCLFTRKSAVGQAAKQYTVTITDRAAVKMSV